MSTPNTPTHKQFRSTINLPNSRGHLSLTTEENPQILLNNLVKSLDTQLYFENAGSTTYVHNGTVDGPVIGWFEEQIVPKNMSHRFYTDAQKNSAAIAA